ncbi:MAG: asparagine synthase-related protein [Gemmatimonadetes bacterium]|nr:asparagine synthase-related protein [Gemmatimonadota bacterium]
MERGGGLRVSGFVGIFDASGAPIDPRIVHAMMTRQAWRGAMAPDVWSEPGAALAVARHEWERSDPFAGDAGLVDDGEVIVAADATLFYRAELRRRIETAGVRLSGDTPSHFILAAYHAWGADCASELEGEFAFAVYDRRALAAFCARDFAGRRPLFFARLGDVFAVGSSVGSLVAHPACPDDFDLAMLGTYAGGLVLSTGVSTLYSAVRAAPFAASFTWTRDGLTRTTHWRPPAVGRGPARRFDDAARELREILAAAVGERLAPEGVSTVWMSGGRDSTAVYAAGQRVLSREEGSRSLRPISISYPEGDLGREDHFIRAVADRWEGDVHWLDIDEIALFDRDQERAATRDEPLTSPYENWNVALARGTRACGSRIALDGNGGDQLFRVSDIYLADLLRGGRWVELVRELRAKRGSGRRYLFESTVAPLLPKAALRALERWRGGTWTNHYVEFPVPRWLHRDFLKRHDLATRQRSLLPRRERGSFEQAELHWLLTSAMPGYALGVLQQRFLETGVEVRAPLMDRRVVEFALGRPRTDRKRGIHDKFLLRAAMKGLIPDDVLAPRDTRTGVTTSYSSRWMKRCYPELFERLLGAPLLLAELGIVDADELRDAVSAYLRGGGDFLRVALFHTLQTELWLRARV